MKSAPSIIFEIGTSNLKIAETYLDNSKIVLENYSIIHLDKDNYSGINKINIDTIIDIIKTEIVSKHYKAKTFRGVVSGEGIISRDILIPKIFQKDLDTMVHEQANQYFPVDLSVYGIDYKVLAEVEGVGDLKFDIYVVAVLQKLIDNYVEVSQKCGIPIEVIDVDANALSKLMIHELKERKANLKNKIIIGLDIGHSYTNIIFIQNGIFRFGREIEFGLNKVFNIFREDNLDDNAIKDKVIEAIEQFLLIHDQQTALDIKDETYDDLHKALDGFCAEIDKVIEFYKTHYHSKSSNEEVPISNIFFTGGGTIRGLDRFIGGNLGIECEKLENFECVVNQSKGGEKGDILFLANVLGTTLRSN